MSYFIGRMPRMSALPPFEEISRDITILQGTTFPADAPARIDGQVDGFNCSPDCQCPGCLMGFGCMECDCSR